MRPKSAAAALMAGWLVGSALAASPPAVDGEAAALAGPKRHRKPQRRPIQLGTSGGNGAAVADENGCGAGTLGALVEKDGLRYVVSSNQVLALHNRGQEGDPILQPGPGDNGCRADPDDAVAELTAAKKLRLEEGAAPRRKNKVDLAAAAVRAGAVRDNGRILKIGVPGRGTLSPTLGLEVKKSGRGSGFTRGEIEAVNVTADVGYDGDLFGRFVNQIVVRGRGGVFARAGDSGAFVYKDVRSCPAAVGLVVAVTDEGSALVSPINAVLKQLKKLLPPRREPVELVGCLPVAARAQQPWRAAASEMEAAAAAQRRLERRLLDLPEVVGVGTGLGAAGSGPLVLKVFVAFAGDGAEGRIPDRAGGFAVEVVEAGPFVAH